MILRYGMKVLQETVGHARQRIFDGFLITRRGHASENCFVGNNMCHPGGKGTSRILRPMVENKSCDIVADKILETFKIRNQHGAPMRHRFERSQSERLTSLSQR